MANPLVSLLDVNVLIAMCYPVHEFHAPVSEWLRVHRADGWATTPFTEAGFVRVSAQPKTNLAPDMESAILLLEKNCAEPDHQFWPQDNRIMNLPREIRRRLLGSQQVTDALLLDLAIRNGGMLVTLDRQILNLLPAESPHRSVIEVIPVA